MEVLIKENMVILLKKNEILLIISYKDLISLYFSCMQTKCVSAQFTNVILYYSYFTKRYFSFVLTYEINCLKDNFF